MQTARYIKHRKTLDKYKVSRGCMDCGYSAHPAALQFDHRNPLEKRGFQRAAVHPNWSLLRIEVELEKCDVVCANCHAIRTAQRGYTGGRPSDSDSHGGIV